MLIIRALSLGLKHTVKAIAITAESGLELLAKSTDAADHLVGKRVLWKVITSWVIRLFSHIHNSQCAVVKESREPLAPTLPEQRLRTRVRHSKSKCVRQLAMGIRKHVDFGALAIPTNLLIVGPRIHDGAIVDAEHQHLIDPKLVEFR